jgi:folylpolyglutamate synthase/dihydrofolate synthase
MQQLASLSAAVLLNTGAAGRQQSLLQPAACFSSSRAAATAGDGGHGGNAEDQQQPGQAFLAGLIDYEKLGVPKSAGVGSSSSSPTGSSSSNAGFDLRVMRQLLAELGNPQQQLKVVHVAGTKGKGSVVVLLSAILRAAGLKVGTYTSPHLFDIRERVVVGGGDAAAGAAAGATTATAAAAPVSAGDWEDLAVQVQAAVQNMQQQQQQQGAGDSSGTASSSRPSHFEVVTAMALQHFAQQRIDIAVIETGLGGATDATNVFGPQQLQAAVLTAIGLDHVEALGGSLRSIAAAKAGIMKAGVPVVVGRQGSPGSSSSTAAAAAAAGSQVSSQPQQPQQQQEGIQGCDSSAAVVWEVLRAAAGQPDMQCPIVAAEHVVTITATTGKSSITIWNGTAPNLARQSIGIQAAMSPLRDGCQQQQQQQQQGATSDSQQQLSLSGVQLQLVGGHQAGNAQTAVAAALLLCQRGWSSITAEAIAAGLQEAWLPGRFQVRHDTITTQHHYHTIPYCCCEVHTSASHVPA